jgi:hypothetical protein
MKSSNRYAQQFKASRAGAKARFAWSISDAVEAKKMTDYFKERISRMDPGDGDFVRSVARTHLSSLMYSLDEAASGGAITRMESQEMKKSAIEAYRAKFSRPGAKAKFAHPLPASLESALKNLDVKLRMLRHAYESNDIEAMSGAGDRVLEAAERVASTSDSAAASLSRVGHHSRPGAKSNGLTLAQRIAVAHDAKRMALR